MSEGTRTEGVSIPKGRDASGTFVSFFTAPPGAREALPRPSDKSRGPFAVAARPSRRRRSHAGPGGDGAEGSPAMTSHAGAETVRRGSGGTASPSMLAMASLEVNDRLQHIDELVEKVDHVQSPLKRRGRPELGRGARRAQRRWPRPRGLERQGAFGGKGRGVRGRALTAARGSRKRRHRPPWNAGAARGASCGPTASRRPRIREQVRQKAARGVGLTTERGADPNHGRADGRVAATDRSACRSSPTTCLG